MRKILIFAATLAVTTTALALPVTPTYTTFGPLPEASFGGSGIPNDRVAITTYQDIVLGLTVTERYVNPAVTDNGAGTFYAVPGGDSPSAYARWNINFYANPGQSALAGYQIRLLYDFDPAVGNDESTLKSLGTASLIGTAQNSWNLGMTFLSGGLPLGGPAFDPNVDGEYSFALQLLNNMGTEVARSAINGQVGAVSTPDGGATAGLLAFGFAGLVFFRHRRMHKMQPIALH